MREVGIHGKDLLVAHGQGVAEALDVGGAQAQLAGPVQYVHAASKALGERLGHRAGPIGRVVIHNEHVKGPLVQDAGHQQLQVAGFIVGGQNDETLPVRLVRWSGCCCFDEPTRQRCLVMIVLIHGSFSPFLVALRPAAGLGATIDRLRRSVQRAGEWWLRAPTLPRSSVRKQLTMLLALFTSCPM